MERLSIQDARVLVTGGAGFIGSELVRSLAQSGVSHVGVIDKLTYAGNLESLPPELIDRERFFHGDIASEPFVRRVFADFRPTLVYHLAAESHVDRSIDDPDSFIRTNIVGTYTLLTVARDYWRSTLREASSFVFVHVSTDEVFGSLGESGRFTEASAYDPSSPYSASKASADHLVRAWQRTFGVPCIVTNCSNNYGPYQFPEKLIPHMIIRALSGDTLPVYGTGVNIRDWLHVSDHARALRVIGERGIAGETYLIGGDSERRNLELVQRICTELDRLRPRATGSYMDLITFVTDRPGHDHRYAIDHDHLTTSLGWRPMISLDEGIESTVRWYLDNESWWRRVLSGEYRTMRLGLEETT